MTTYIGNYLQQASREEVKNWINGNLINYLNKGNSEDIGEIEHIIDYLNSNEAPRRLKRMSYVQAKSNSDKWMATQIKKGNQIGENEDDLETFIDFGNGFKFVRLIGENAFKREGHLMSHCVSSYYDKENCKIYSLRDQNNKPHATIEIGHYDNKNESIRQIKGKGNGSIHSNYINLIIGFITKVGLEVQSYELNNLGYYFIDNVRYERLKDTKGLGFLEHQEKQYLYIHSKPKAN